MTFLRVFGAVIALSGLALLMLSMLGIFGESNNAIATYGLFGMLAGLLLAMAADAGQKMGDRGKASKKDAKNEE